MLNTRKFDSITPVLKELRWLPASYYLMYTVGVLAFECAKGLTPSYLSDRFVTRSSVHDRDTRNKDYLNIPAYQSAVGQRTFHIEKLNSRTHYHVRSLLQIACVLSKTNLENYFLNHF